MRGTTILLCLAVSAVARAEPLPELECLLEPPMRVEIATAVEAVIEKVHVDRGDRVKQGELLVELDAGVERAAVELAELQAKSRALRKQNEVRLSYSERALARQEELSHSAVISASQLDEARSARMLAESGLLQADEQEGMAEKELERARALLALRRLASPIDGIVVKRHRSPGELATEQPLLEVVDLDPLYVEVLAPADLFGRVQPGMRARVLPEIAVAGDHVATVTVVDPLIDGASGTFGIRLELPNPDYTVPAGLDCRLRFELGAPEAVAAKPAVE